MGYSGMPCLLIQTSLNFLLKLQFQDFCYYRSDQLSQQMNRILAVAILLGITGCSYTQPYVTNISPAGKNEILVEKCKIQMNQLTTQISDSSCNTSYVWLGGEVGKNISDEGSNPNNNVITIK